ncbi:MAG: DUF5681 domain-containing protein, partial [Hyphomicrobiales bacterium]
MQDHEDEHNAGTAAADTEVKRRGRPFQPGQSGNPKGRPKGSRNVTTLMLEALLEGEGEAILGKFIERAMQGDSRAQKACIYRLLPAGRDRRVSFRLPDIATEDDGPKATQALLSAVAAGEISASEASTVMKLLDAHMQMLRRRREETEPSERVKHVLSDEPYDEDDLPPLAEEGEAQPEPVAEAQAQADPVARAQAQAEPVAPESAKAEPIAPREIGAKPSPREPAEPVWVTQEQAVAELDAEDEAEAKRKADAALRARYTHEAVIASLLWERQTLDDRLAQRDA